MARTSLLDGLCTNLSVLCSSCASLDACSDAASVAAHRSAYKAYVALMAHVLRLGEAEAKEAAPPPAAGAAKVRCAARGRRSCAACPTDWAAG